MRSRNTGLIIALSAVGGFFIILLIGLVSIFSSIGSSTSLSTRLATTDTIDVISIEGPIGIETTDFFGNTTYNHQFILDSIESLIDDEYNRGLVLFIDSPGGAVYQTDEIYLKVLEYKEKTGRPVYASFGSMAASGGYYIAAAADKIISNRNTLTGSIGVIGGSFIDLSEFLDKQGIRVHTVTAGKNKAMGDLFSPTTDEQLAIYQSILNETHVQFIDIIATGRNMTVEEVEPLADGRLYTAKQALSHNLIDAIGTYDDTLRMMKDDLGLADAEIYEHTPEQLTGLDALFMQLKALQTPSDLQAALELQQVINQFGYLYPGARFN